MTAHFGVGNIKHQYGAALRRAVPGFVFVAIVKNHYFACFPMSGLVANAQGAGLGILGYYHANMRAQHHAGVAFVRGYMCAGFHHRKFGTC